MCLFAACVVVGKKIMLRKGQGTQVISVMFGAIQIILKK